MKNVKQWWIEKDHIVIKQDDDTVIRTEPIRSTHIERGSVVSFHCAEIGQSLTKYKLDINKSISVSIFDLIDKFPSKKLHTTSAVPVLANHVKVEHGCLVGDNIFSKGIVSGQIVSYRVINSGKCLSILHYVTHTGDYHIIHAYGENLTMLIKDLDSLNLTCPMIVTEDFLRNYK